MKKYLSLLLTFVLGLSVSVLRGQQQPAPPIVNISQLEIPGNVASKHVQAINQDPYGFMWFGSQNGLHRWDGYEFLSFRHQTSDSSSISSNYVEVIHVAADQSLWIGTYGGGLNHYEYGSQRFTRYQHDSLDIHSLSNDLVTGITEDSLGNLWIATMNGLNHFDRRTQRFKRYYYGENQPDNQANVCRSICIDANGTLWVGTGFEWVLDEGGGLHRYRPETDDFEHFYHCPEDSTSLVSNKVTAIYEDSHQQLWIGTGKRGLHLMDRSTGTFRRHPKGDPVGSSSFIPFSGSVNYWSLQHITEDNMGRLWFSEWGVGFKCYDPETNFSIHLYAGMENGDLAENAAWATFQSRDGTIWLCTAGTHAGVYQVYTQDSPFAYYQFSEEADDAALTFFEDDAGTVWIGTRHSGLWYWQNGQFYPEKRIRLNGIQRIVADQNGQIWLWSPAANTLLRWHPATNAQTTLGPEFGVQVQHISDICADETGQVWLLNTAADIVAGFDEARQQFDTYSYKYMTDLLADRQYQALLRPDDQGKLWIIGFEFSQTQLLTVSLRFDPKSRSLVPIHEAYPDWKINKKERTAPRLGHHVTIVDARMDSKGGGWTLSEEVLQHRRGNALTAMSASRGLPSKADFRGMVLNEDGTIWLLTDWLMHYHPEENLNDFVDVPGCEHAINSDFCKFYNLGWNIQAIPGQQLGLFKNSNNHLFWGVQSGLQYIHADTLLGMQPAHPPAPKFVEIAALSTTDSLSFASGQHPALFQTNTLALAHDNNAFELSFATFHFQQGQNQQYQYMLEGYETDWRKPTTSRSASYVHLPAGKYTFKVRTSLDGSNWSEPARLSIHVARAWYASGWAYVIYLSLALSLLYLFYQFQFRNQLSRAEVQREKEINAEKSHLYTNITHEFRTPLTVILGLADTLKTAGEQQRGKALLLIQRNGQYLLQRVNQILELARLDHQQMTLDLQRGNVVNFARYVAESFTALANEKEINLVAYAESDHIDMDFDGEKLQTIITNLLSNALKFTDPGGQVVLHLQARNEGGSPFLIMKVRDNGIGMSEDEQQRLFKRFYRGASKQHLPQVGTGIGLALSRELVMLMGGRIQVKSRLGEGTEFTVYLPITRQATHTATHAPALASAGLPGLDSYRGISEEARPDEGGGPLVLLIEDNADIAYLLESILADQYRLLWAADGDQGLALAFEQLPDIIISDIMMPSKDGLDVCQTLKADPRTDHIPIILLTAKTTLHDRLQGLRHGADAYLNKPFVKAELLARLEQLILLRKKLRKKLEDNPFEQILYQHQHKPEEQFLQKAIQAILDHLEEPEFSARQLARSLHMSESQLYRKLKALSGKSTGIFIRSIRLQQAKSLVLDSALPITSIAYNVGFKDVAWFSRAFKEEFGQAPSFLRSAV